jgi:type I restriction enzyme M protein
VGNGGRTPLSVWYDDNPGDVAAFEKQMRRKAHYVIQPEASVGKHRLYGPTQDEQNC